MINQILNNKRTNFKLLENGFIKINLANPNKVKEIRDFYFQITPKSHQSSFASFITNDKSYKKLVNEHLIAFLNTHLEATISKNYIPIFSNFMVKPPKKENLLLHSDWTYTDEKNFTTYNLWYPLEKITNKNGGVWLIPRSHKFMKGIRGINLPRNQYPNEEILQTKYAIPIKVNPGEALIWDARLLHFSYPNFSENIRLAVSNFFVPKDAPVFYHYYDYQKGCLNRYKVPSPDFLIHQPFDEMPDKKFLIERFENNEIGKFDFNTFTKMNKKSSFINRLKSESLKKQINNEE